MNRRDSSLAPGSTFEERYQILAPLGEGGFGAVYKARQITSGQPVAVKIMRLPEHGGAARMDRRIARFLREASLCAQLHHPNIVQLIDSGQTGEGQLYSVFAFAPGDNLADLLAREGALGPREARHLMLQVLDALACSHDEGVVHRDLKPRNIMVIPTGARRNALVLDFGIGAIIGGAEGEDSARLTATEETLGTPGYAAPEQLRGFEPLPRADLFAWGLVLLECLTGTPVYRGSSAAEILYQQLGPDPVPIPGALEGHPLGDIVRRATRKDAAERDVTARELFEALDACEVRGLTREAMLGASSADPATLHARTAPEPEPASGPVAPLGERRQLTAVCCLLGARAIGQKALDSEELDEILRGALTLCADVARRHRGHLAAALGDEVLLYFGYPRAEEDDARHAARAAFAILIAIQAENERLAVTRGARIDVRIGVHTGLTLTGDLRDGGYQGLAVGATPRIAARVAASARTGCAAVTADAQRLLRASFDFEADGARSIEGIDEPVKVFRLREERGDRGPTPTPEGHKTPIVGRDQEIELLLERWRRTRAGGGQCSLITGEPGIGKSRLAQELRDRIFGETHAFLEGRCSPDTRNNALYTIIELLGRTLELDQVPLPRARVERLEGQLVRYGFSPAEAMPLFLPLFALPLHAPHALRDVSPQRQKELTLHAILSLLFAMAEERPLLLLIEDMHWADPTTIELLTQIVREAPSSPLCIVLTARPEFSPSFPTTGVLQLPLSRLERPQTEAMLAELWGKKVLPPAVIEQVASRTDGVPLFVEELSRMMIESGVLIEREDHYELAGTLAELPIPGTLRALLMARLDRLGRAKETAQTAAALGREFSVEVLSALGLSSAEAVREDLNVLVDAGLVFRRRRFKDAGCVFKHALIRDAAYESLPRSARQRVHARIAGTLEAQFPDVVRARPDLLAHHHAAAEQKRQAIDYAQRAAQEALQRSAYLESIRSAEGALGWLDAIGDARERAEAELGLTGLMVFAMLAHCGAGDPDLARAAVRALDLIDTLGDTANTAPTLWRLLLYYLHIRPEKARVIADRLLALAERSGDVGQAAALLPIVGQCFWLEGRFDEARTCLDRALALYDPELHRQSAFTYGIDSRVYAQLILGLLLWFMGYPEQALAHGQAGVAWARQLEHPMSVGNGLLFVAGVHHYRMETAAVLAAAGAGMKLGDRYGIVTVEVFNAILHAWAAGDLEEARRRLSSVRAAGEELCMTYWIAVVADAEARGGRHDAALELIQECLRRAGETGEIYYVPELHRLDAVYRMARGAGDEEAVEASLRRAIDVAKSQHSRMPELRASLALGLLLQSRGQLDEAVALVRPIHEWFSEGLDLPDLVEARALLKQIDQR